MAGEKNYIYIHNFGCQMNLHDTQRMLDVLRPYGYETAQSPEQADVILLNTCSVREKPQAKVISTAGRYRLLKQQKPQLLLGIAGCVAQQLGGKLFSLVPDLDLVFGPDHIAKLPALLDQARDEQRLQVGFAEIESYRFLQASPAPGQQAVSALVTIQKGCDNHCSYCIVPLVRGPEVSRPAAEIIKEIEKLAEQTHTREITLIGQNVNSYRGLSGADDDFARLLRQVDAIPAIWRIRFTTSHPKDFHEALIRCFGELEHLCPWLHLPVQSGSSRVLSAMNRGYSRERYLELIAQVRERCPELCIGTDIIVGFPGERDEDFEQTLSLVEQIQYDYAYCFKYSVRPGTPASTLVDDVPEAIKRQRLHHLQALQDGITRARLAAQVGKTLPVLLEGPSRKGLPQVCGRAPGNQVVNVTLPDSAELANSLINVQITAAGSHSLHGELC